MGQQRGNRIFFLRGWGWLAWGVGAYTSVRYLTEISNISPSHWPSKLIEDYRAAIYPIYSSAGIPLSVILRDIVTIYLVGVGAQLGHLMFLTGSRIPILPQHENMPIIEYMEPRIKTVYVLLWPLVIPADIILKVVTGTPLAFYIARNHPRGATKETLDHFTSLRLVALAFFKYLLIGLVIVACFTVVNASR